MALSWFGLEFAHKFKELIDQVKTTKSSSTKDHKPHQVPPTAGGLQPTTRERWKPDPPERTSIGMPEAVDIVINIHIHTNYLVMNFKSILIYHLVCLGVNQVTLADVPQVQGYQINLVSELHQKSPPTPQHYTLEQISLIQDRLSNGWNSLWKWALFPTYSWFPKRMVAETSYQPESSKPICSH